MQSVSTCDVPRRQRLAYVHDFIARNWAGMHVVPLREDDLHIDISVFTLPDSIRMARARYPAMVGRRSRELLGDGRDNYMLAVVSEDHEVRIEGGASFTARAGDLTLLSEGSCFELRHPRAATVEVVSLAHAQIAARVPRFGLQPCYHIPRTTPGASLLTGYAGLLRQAPPEDGRAQQMAADHIHDLMALVLDGFAPHRAGQAGRGIRVARLELLKREVRQRAADPSLSVQDIARSQGVTPRYVQQLFERDGTTFTAFLRDTRLAMAHRMLSEGELRASITAIAFAAGFADLSHFNRCFRQRYGLRPSELRAEALRRQTLASEPGS